MAVGVGDDGATAPWGIAGWGDDGGWIVAKGGEDGLERWDAEADASTEGGRCGRGERIEFEDAAAEFCGKMLWAAAVLVPGELQTQARVKLRGALQVGGAEYDEIEGGVVHQMV